MNFSDFWNAYPKKVGKAAARKKWDQKKLDDQADKIVFHVKQRAKDDKKWKDGFTLDPATFLNQERWEDEYERIQFRAPPPTKVEVKAENPQPCQWEAWLNVRLLSVLMHTRIAGFEITTARRNELVAAKNVLAGRMREQFGNEMNTDAGDFKKKWPDASSKLVIMSKQAYDFLSKRARAPYATAG
jgi:hypothetical protein